jgi:putative phosphoribosyl transferase
VRLYALHAARPIGISRRLRQIGELGLGVAIEPSIGGLPHVRIRNPLDAPIMWSAAVELTAIPAVFCCARMFADISLTLLMPAGHRFRYIYLMTLYRDRTDAGRQLAERLADYKDKDDILVLALPRGGVPVAYEIAIAINAPLDVLTVRKLGTPGQPELAMGAIASGGVRVMNEDVLRLCGVSDEEIELVAERELAELARREQAYRGERKPPGIAGKIVILVDDGVATGATMKAAVAALRHLDPARVVVAVPHGAAETIDALRREADEVVCLATPWPYMAVGSWYQNFTQVSDREVAELLEAADEARAARCE